MAGGDSTAPVSSGTKFHHWEPKLCTSVEFVYVISQFKFTLNKVRTVFGSVKASVSHTFFTMVGYEAILKGIKLYSVSHFHIFMQECREPKALFFRLLIILVNTISQKRLERGVLGTKVHLYSQAGRCRPLPVSADKWYCHVFDKSVRSKVTFFVKLHWNSLPGMRDPTVGFTTATKENYIFCNWWQILWLFRLKMPFLVIA